MITLEKVLFLCEVGLFEHVPAVELAKIADITEEVVVPRGEVIFREGDFGDALYVIVEGRVRISLRAHVLDTLGERQYFGEMSLLDGEPRSASALAETDALLLRIRQEEFHRILARNFDVALAVIRTLSRRLRAQLADTQSDAHRRRDSMMK